MLSAVSCILILRFSVHPYGAPKTFVYWDNVLENWPTHFIQALGWEKSLSSTYFRLITKVFCPDPVYSSSHIDDSCLQNAFTILFSRVSLGVPTCSVPLRFPMKVSVCSLEFYMYFCFIFYCCNLTTCFDLRYNKDSVIVTARSCHLNTLSLQVNEKPMQGIPQWHIKNLILEGPCIIFCNIIYIPTRYTM